jgi:hypothetical protein
MKRVFFLIFRAVLALYLISLGIKGLADVNFNKVTISQTIDYFEQQFLQPYKLNLDLVLLKKHPVDILYFENLCIVYGGFLMLFGFSLSKAFITTGILIEIIFLNNIIFMRDEKTLINFGLVLSLLGGVLSSNSK